MKKYSVYDRHNKSIRTMGIHAEVTDKITRGSLVGEAHAAGYRVVLDRNHSRMTEEFAISRVLIGIREEPKSDQKMAPCYGDFVSRW